MAISGNLNLFGLKIAFGKEGGIAVTDHDTARSSLSIAEQLTGFNQKWGSLTPPNEAVWTSIENAALYNPDISNSLHTLVSLADTQHEIRTLTGKPISPRALAVIAAFQIRCFPLAGGIDGLQLALINQYCRYGAESAEAEIDLRNRWIKAIWIVPVYQIRFRWLNGEFMPLQYINGKYIDLHSLTYRYLCAEFWQQGLPYAKPPMLSALDAVIRQNEIITNLNNILEKIGLLGINDVTFEPAPPKVGEDYSSPEYIGRVQAFQNALVTNEKSRTREQFRVHTNKIEYKNTQVAAPNAAGVRSIYELNEELVSSGAGVPEALLGRPRATTEAFAKVMYQLVTNYAETAQRLTASFLAYYYNLELALNGINEQVDVVFAPIAALDSLKEEQSEKVRLENIGYKEDRGWIDIRVAAQEAGYEKPEALDLTAAPDQSLAGVQIDALSAIVDKVILGVMPPETGVQLITASFPFDEVRARAIINSVKGFIPKVVITPEVRQASESASLVLPAERLKDFNKLSKRAKGALTPYLRATNDASGKAKYYAFAQVEEYLRDKNISNFMEDPDIYAEKVMQAISEGFALANPAYQAAIEQTVTPFLSYMLLTDNSSFPNRVPPVKIEWSGTAQSLVDFNNRFETQLGTSIWSNPNRPNHLQLSQYLRDEFFAKGNDIFSRTNPSGYEQFRIAFKDQLDHLTDGQIRRIQDTFVMRVRNQCGLEQLHQARVKYAEINTTPNCCSICQPYQGRKFEVARQYEAMVKQLAMTPDEFLDHLKSNTTLINDSQRRDGEEDAAWRTRSEKNWEAMQGAGVALPTYHPGCQHEALMVDDIETEE